MTSWRLLIDAVFQHEPINFALTNRIPRRLATLFMGRVSRIEQPVVRDLSMAIWRLFAGDLNLAEAKKTRFSSLHDCFTRELKEGARTVDRAPDVAVSPCDAIVGAAGRIEGSTLFQAKDSTYTLEELVADPALATVFRDGWFVTLRLTSTMYHRFHAPHDCAVEELTYVSGDVWNVNPVALKRVPRLFCQNERAVVPLRLAGSDDQILLVPVAAILVASIHFNFAGDLNLRFQGRERRACHARFTKGEEMGHFRHGSTILALATRRQRLCGNVRQGAVIRMGQPLFQVSRSD